MQVRFGSRMIPFPSDPLGELRDSAPLRDDGPALRQRLDEDGYLMIRGAIPRERVLQARQRVMQHMNEAGALTPGTPVLEGVMPQGGRGVPLMGRKGITHAPQVQGALEAPELFALHQALFGEPVITYDYKWMRAVGNEQYTGAHMDVVYMGRGTLRLHTTWIPMGDIEPEQGTLAILVGSHRLPEFEKIRRTYGRMDVDRDHIAGWFSEEPFELTEQFGGQWQTAAMRAGDVIIFGMHTMHASTTNLTTRFRLSSDVRFQPASEPVDPRWIGDAPAGHDHAKQTIPMATARQQWGV